MKISVGDVLFVLDRKTRAVVPCQLVEIISSITLDGETTKHVVVTPSGKKRFQIEDHPSPWFETYRDAHNYLKEAALKLVEDTMNKARKVSMDSFGVDVRSRQESFISSSAEEYHSENQKSSQTTLDLEDHSETLYVDMGGQKVKVSLPKELSNV